MQKLNSLPSVSNFWFNCFAFVLSLITFFAGVHKQLPPLHLILICSVAYSLPILVFEYLTKTPNSIDTAKTAFSWKDVVLKLMGLTFTLSLVLFMYWLFPEYQKSLYQEYWQFLEYIAVIVVILAPLYFIVMVKINNDKDAYWFLGKVLYFEYQDACKQCPSAKTLLSQHCLTWIVKAFFLPIMFVFLIKNIEMFLNHEQKPFFFLAITILFTIDLFIAMLGYLFTLKLFNIQIRTVDATLFGWVVCLICYQPFNSTILVQYLSWMKAQTTWLGWIKYDFLMYAWGSICLALLSIYVLSTLIFGLRFSNLTNRGIITNGPYRFSKHPAYIAKNLFWWFTTVPFAFITTTPAQSIKAIFFLLGINLIYYLRAKTEERHLSCSPAYVEYTAWINQNGLIARIRRCLS